MPEVANYISSPFHIRVLHASQKGIPFIMEMDGGDKKKKSSI